MQRVVKRAQIGRNFFLQIARQKAERLARFDRRPGQDDAVDLLFLQGGDRHGHREISLARPGRADAEDDIVFLNRLDVIALAEACARRSAVCAPRS